MIIDVHTHPWMEDEHIFHPEGVPLLEAMDEYNIDKSVSLSMDLAENEWVARMNRDHPKRIIPFVWVELNQGIIPALNRLEKDVASAPFKGIKLYPIFSHIGALEQRMYPVYTKAVELDLVCLWHMGDVGLIDDREGRVSDISYSPSPITIARIAADFPELKIILAHLGGNFYHEALALVERHENVYLDTSWLNYYVDRNPSIDSPLILIEEAVKVVGAERILYGGEGIWPVDIMATDLSEEEKALILGENASRILNL